MPVTEEQFESWIQDVDTARASTEDRWEENFVKLASRKQLDSKVLELGDTPRLMADVRDPDGNTLVRKYDQLTKPVWQRLRSREDTPHVYFICEKPIRVVESINLEFFNYDDYQILGAFLAEKGKQKSAGYLFTEALKCETADAFINKGVYHYRAGDTGVFDNYRLSKKHLDKGLVMLRRMRLLPPDESFRRKTCQKALDEIDFKTSAGPIRWIKAFVRLVTFHFEPDIFYVGAADRKILKNGDILRSMFDTIAKYELQMLKDAVETFVYSVKIEIPSDFEDAVGTLDAAVARTKEARTEGEVVELAGPIGEIYARSQQVAARRDQVRTEAKRAAELSIVDRLTGEELAQIKRLDMSYSLKSPRELTDLAERKDLDRTTMLWLYKERSHIKMIMEALYHNAATSDDLKQEMAVRLGLGGRPRSF